MCNVRAAELGHAKGNPAHWNAGIAATALSDWPAARHAWSEFGIPIDAGDGPPNGKFGRAPVRLNPASGGEVVWAERLDPARARIENIPFPESGHRWGDIVLHDGAPEGERIALGRSYPVFDELARLVASPFETYVADVVAPLPSDIEALASVFRDAGLAAEDWSTSVRALCDDCSRGAPHEHRGVDAAGGTPHRIGLAARTRTEAERLLAAWARPDTGRRWTLLAALADGP
jgi:hypothetical protein